MILRTAVLVLAGLFCLPALAGPSPAPVPAPADLPGTIQRQVATRETLRTQAEDGQAALRKWYESSLDVVRADAANKANLDAVLATDAERGRMDRDLTAEESAALPKVLRDLRVRYDQARLQRVTQYKTSLTASLREYMLTLDGLEKSLTRKLDIEGAVAARKERAAAGEEMNALAAPGAVAPLGRPATAAGSPAAPARSGPYVRPTAPEPVKVASELKANGTIQTPGPNVIPFDMPPTPRTIGPVADGGHGVLLKNDPSAGRNGTTWTLNWTYNPISFYGLTFIHPFGPGHVMVRLRSSRVEPVSKTGWETQPMLAGGSMVFFKAEGTSEAFPLQPNRKYAIVAQLDAKGHYTLSIDGQVMRSADYGSPDAPSSPWLSPTPIALPEGFKGEGLPMKWEAGFAGLLVWPTMPGTVNLCEDITFQVGAPSLAQAPPATPPRTVVPPSTLVPPARVTPPAGATPPVALAGTPVRATPAPIHASSLSANDVGTAPVVQVGSELKLSGTLQNPAKEAVPFETPLGFNHTKGGRGVLLKNDPGVGRRGSTWRVEWTSSYSNAILFVHPHNNGHIIVRLGMQGATPVYLSGFQTQPMMSGGPLTIFKETAAAADVYPLKTNQKYAIVSQFDSKGRYSLTIDGKVVQAGAFSSPGELGIYVSPAPLTLPAGFTGENLPMKWKAGYAALMLVPVSDTGVSLCENISFQGSAPPADKSVR